MRGAQSGFRPQRTRQDWRHDEGRRVVLADSERHEGLGRVIDAMITAGEMHEAGDDVRLVFDGGGTVWPGELAEEDHPAHPLWESVRDVVAGACSYCADAFEARAGVEQAG